MNQEGYSKILYKLKLIYEKHKTLKKAKSNFNIFSVLRHSYDEVNLHSKFIAGILNEEKYGRDFLYSLLKIIDFPIPKDLTSREINKINVEKEKSTKDGRIDIFISFNAKKTNYSLVIENKLWAGDQCEQMNRYLNYLSSRINEVNGAYYLTLDGHEPSAESCRDINKIKLISYDDHILDWINECIKIAARESSIREVLIQYESLLEEILGKDRGVIMDMKEYILENSENYDFAVNLQEALIEAKTELQLRFWKKIEAKLEEKLKVGYNLPVENTNKDISIGSYNYWYSEEIIKRFYKGTKGARDYGVIYNQGYAKDIGDLYLKVETSWYSLYFGLKKAVPINENSDNYKKLVNELGKNNFNLTDDNWVCWEYINNGDKKINFKELNSNLAKLLIDEKELDLLIENSLVRIKELIDIVQKYK